MRIVLIEDNQILARAVEQALRQDGHSVDWLADGADGAQFLADEGADLAIVDINLPRMSGLDVVRGLVAAGGEIPVMMLTARDALSDRVAGLDAGADDYLAKPFQSEELIARLRALIRRASGNTSSELIAGDVRLDTRSGRVTLAGEPVKLTAQEYKLLSYLMHHKGKVVSRTELIEHIYDQDFDRDSNTIEVFVTRIRKKLGADIITTIRGLGYSLDDPADAPRG